MNATIRHHIEPVFCPSCNGLMIVTHRYQSVHQVACDNAACRNYAIPFEQPYQDFELKPVAVKHKEAHCG